MNQTYHSHHMKGPLVKIIRNRSDAYLSMCKITGYKRY